MEKGRANKGANNIITAADFQDSRHEFIRISQNTSFKEEINNLKQEKHVTPAGSIAPLSPLINSARLLCVGGRLKAANIPPNSKHQILISKNHPIAKLLITDIHLNYAHLGREYTLCILRQNYWILASRGLIRKILSNCFFSKRRNAKQIQPQMTNLPNIRLQSNYSHIMV